MTWWTTATPRWAASAVLVNNAGMSPLLLSLPEVSEELFDKVIGVTSSRGRSG